MRHPLVPVAGALLLAACPGRAALFPSRVPLAPLQEKLAAQGGDPARVMTPRAPEELSGLKPGRRYKYVVTAEGRLRIAPRPADEPGNEYVHPVLAQGEPVRTAGYLRYERRDATTTYELVYVDQDSKAYCPTFASLGEARWALSRLGVGRDRVRLEDHPPSCVPLPGEAATTDASAGPSPDAALPPSPAPGPSAPPAGSSR